MQLWSDPVCCCLDVLLAACCMFALDQLDVHWTHTDVSTGLNWMPATMGNATMHVSHTAHAEESILRYASPHGAARGR